MIEHSLLCPSLWCAVMERESCEQWDPLQQAPFFNYLESGTQHQVRALNTGTQHQVRALRARRALRALNTGTQHQR